MKVLHIALKTNISPNIELVNALKSLGEYHEINWMPQQRRHLNDFILSESKRIKPDFTFMQIQEPNIINPEVAKQIGGFVVNWMLDNPLLIGTLRWGKTLTSPCLLTLTM